MATHQYTVSEGATVGAGTDRTFTMPEFSVPSGEKLKRLKIGRAGTGETSYCRLRGNAQSVLGQNGFDVWTTDKTAVSWTDGGTAKVKVHNTGTQGYSWRISVTFETEDLPYTPVKAGEKIKASDLNQTGKNVKAGTLIKASDIDNKISAGTKITASGFNSKVLGL